MGSGLYADLVGRGLLVEHELVEMQAPGAFAVLKPRQVPFISYPYEWCFSQLKDAAVLTLRVARRALRYGMILKDASAYNIQFLDGQPCLIDTLSFDFYAEGEPWVAYRQFCQHFLAPLALMAHVDLRLGATSRVFLDGLPLDLAARLLPWRCRLSAGLSIHLFLHARAAGKYAGAATKPKRAGMSRTAFEGLLASLQDTVAGLDLRVSKSQWSPYYAQSPSYTPEALEDKKSAVAEMLAIAKPGVVWDLGANVGLFSQIASQSAHLVVAMDFDPLCTELHYRSLVQQRRRNVLPLTIDLANPSPALGWSHQERQSLLERGPADCVMALALVHHLAIGNNVPLPMIVDFLAQAGRWAIVEFVPKSDPQVQRMLALREDIFDEYAPEPFKATLAAKFEIVREHQIRSSQRVLYLLKRR